MANHDVIVVGAGIEGSSIAYTLANYGKKVLLLEQFPLPHSRGSSHGQSRIFTNNGMGKFFERLTADSAPLWRALEKESKKQLLLNCGVLTLCPKGSKTWQKRLRDVQRGMKDFALISPEDLRSRYPMFTVDDNIGAIFYFGGGILKPNQAIEAFQSVFKAMGGVLKDRSRVTSIIPGTKVKVETTEAVYTAESVVIAAGAWSGRFTSALGINAPSLARKALVYYWKVAKDVDSNLLHYSAMPIFLYYGHDDDRHNYYAVPIFEYPGLVKVCLESSPPCDPDNRDQTDHTWVEENICQAVKRTLPWLEDKPSITETCMITVTPDSMPYIDRHPLHSNIVFAFGFSGMGFSIAPVVGKIVNEMVSGSKPSYNLRSLRFDRFYPKPKM